MTADWMIPDPYNSQSFNRYSYVNNNPVNFVDPSGNEYVAQYDGQVYMGITVTSGAHTSSLSDSAWGISSDGLHPGLMQWQFLQSTVQGIISSPQGVDNVQASADIAGIFDPTPTVDLANAAAYVQRGKYGDAAVSVISAVPYAGDLIGKGGKYLTIGVKRVISKITVIGSRSDTLKYLGKKGYNVLNIKKWTPAKNIKWLDEAIERGDDILLATDPLKHQKLMQELNKASGFTDLELPHLLERGHIQKGNKMIK